MTDRIKNMVILSGPLGIGKSTILSNILDPQIDPIPAIAPLRINPSWKIWNPTAFLKRDSTTAFPTQVVFQYELTRLITRPSFSLTDFDKDPVLEIRNMADKVSLITLWAPGAIIAKRVKSRMPLATRVKEIFNHSRRHKAAFALYAKPDKLADLYLRWFEFWNSATLKVNLVLDISKSQPTQIPIPDFKASLQNLREPKNN